MLKSLRLGATLIAILATPISTTFLASPASAFPRDLADSSRSVDKRFIEDYNTLALIIPDGYKNIVETPEEASRAIFFASFFCKALRKGIPVNLIFQIEENILLKTLQDAGRLEDEPLKKYLATNMALANKLAPKYYCPEFSN